MKLAVLGAGNVGGTLAAALSSAHEIVLGVRDPEASKYKELAKRIGHATSVASIREAADSAEAILLATPWSASPSSTDWVGTSPSDSSGVKRRDTKSRNHEDQHEVCPRKNFV